MVLGGGAIISGGPRMGGGVPYRSRMLKSPIPLMDKIFETLIAKTEARPQPAGQIHDLVEMRH